MAKRNRNADCSFCRKNYRDVGPLVEGPGDVYICGECIKLCQSILDQEKRRRRRAEGTPPPTAETIGARLERLVPGQDDARDALVGAALGHLDRSWHEPRSPVLLLGSTHSSRAFLARALAHVLEVPFAEGDADALVRPTGGGMEPLLDRLITAGDFDMEAIHRGVVYVEGIDRIETQQRLSDLLRVGAIESTALHLQIDVRRLLFLCGGEFGVLCPPPGQPVTQEALQALGITGDLIRRGPIIARVAPLDEETLVRLVSCADFQRMSAEIAAQTGEEV